MFILMILVSVSYCLFYVVCIAKNDMSQCIWLVKNVATDTKEDRGKFICHLLPLINGVCPIILLLFASSNIFRTAALCVLSISALMETVCIVLAYYGKADLYISWSICNYVLCAFVAVVNLPSPFLKIVHITSSCATILLSLYYLQQVFMNREYFDMREEYFSSSVLLENRVVSQVLLFFVSLSVLI